MRTNATEADEQHAKHLAHRQVVIAAYTVLDLGPFHDESAAKFRARALKAFDRACVEAGVHPRPASQPWESTWVEDGAA